MCRHAVHRDHRVSIFPVVTDAGRPPLNGCEMSALLEAEIRVQDWAG